MVKNVQTVRIEQWQLGERGGVEERRLPVKLYYYWDGLRGDRLFPSENLINHDDIPDLWDHCYLIQVNDLQNRLRVDFTYLGAEILKTYKTSLSEEDANDIIAPRSSRLALNFSRIIEEKAPLLQSGEFMTQCNQLIRFRQCLLPLGETDARVEAIFGCARLKVYL